MDAKRKNEILERVAAANDGLADVVEEGASLEKQEAAVAEWKEAMTALARSTIELSSPSSPPNKDMKDMVATFREVADIYKRMAAEFGKSSGSL